MITRKKTEPAPHERTAKFEAFPMLETIESLREVRGDIIFAVLLLPIALTYQKLAEKIIKLPASLGEALSRLPDIAILGMLLFTYVMEVLAISLVILNPNGYSELRKKFLLTVFTLGFMIAITLMGVVKDPTVKSNALFFKAAFAGSIITSFGQLYLVGWDESHEDIGHRHAFLVSIPISIALILLYFP